MGRRGFEKTSWMKWTNNVCIALDPSGNTGRAGYADSKYSAMVLAFERICGGCWGCREGSKITGRV